MVKITKVHKPYEDSPCIIRLLNVSYVYGFDAYTEQNTNGQNKGGGAAAAALHLIALTRKWEKPQGKVGFLPAEENTGA